MMGINVPNQVPFANGNIPYLEVTNITVGTAAVDLAMGYRRVPATGILLIRIPQAIPAGGLCFNSSTDITDTALCCPNNFASKISNREAL